MASPEPSHDAVDYALEQLQSIGLLLNRENFEIDGKLKRLDAESAKKGKKAGWYVCNWLVLDDGRNVVVGAYGIWVGAENHAHKLKFDGASRISDAERRRFKVAQELAAQASERERQDRAGEAARRAAAIWAKLPDSGRSGYLLRKGVGAYGLKFGRDGSIAIPMRNEAGLLAGLQWIDGEGEKRFLTGSAKLGAWHLIGEIKLSQPLVLAEGYATGASVHEATGWAVAVCFDCGNLWAAGKRLRTLHPDVPLLIAGDDDHQKPENAGRTHAPVYARKLGGSAVFPVFLDANGRTDFNDLHAEQGIDVVRAQLLAAWSPPKPDDDEPDHADGEGDPQGDRSWRRELIYGDKGLKPMLHNVMLVLEHHDDWAGVLGYDEFAKRLVLRKPPPYFRREGARANWLSDTDEIEIAAWFGRRKTYAASIPTSLVREAATAVAERHAFHPIREYLNGLKWDGTQRLERFFSDFCSVPHGEAVAAFARVFFIQAVARVMRPGCKADFMLVLEGEQGARKSTLAETLFGKGFYADVGTAPSDKDFFQIIQGCWGAEISEMASFAKAESAHIKRAISVATDRYRKSYGHNVEDFKRECVFFGTVNNQDWQRDETGGRRYGPIWVGDIDIEAVAGVRDLLWAEAVARFQSGEDWWVLPDEAKDEQETRYVEDVWTAPVWRWLEGRGSPDSYRTGTPKAVIKTDINELLWRVCDLDLKKQDRSAQTRMGNLMRRLGWTVRQESLAKGKGRVRFYHRPVDKQEVDS